MDTQLSKIKATYLLLKKLSETYHAFNKHDNYGSWCEYKNNEENYEHANIPGGFKSDVLFENLKNIFNQLADNSSRYAAAASSRANESLNNSITRKLPKNICYCTSESADLRVLCAVCQKKNFSFFFI